MYLLKVIEYYGPGKGPEDHCFEEGKAVFRIQEGERIKNPIRCPFCGGEVFPPVEVNEYPTTIKVFDFEPTTDRVVLVVVCYAKHKRHAVYFSSIDAER